MSIIHEISKLVAIVDENQALLDRFSVGGYKTLFPRLAQYVEDNLQLNLVQLQVLNDQVKDTKLVANVTTHADEFGIEYATEAEYLNDVEQSAEVV